MKEEEAKFYSMTRKHKPFMDHVDHFHMVMIELDRAIQKSKAPVIEIGTRKGGSALCFLEVLKQAEKKNWLFTVDPYGSLPYTTGEQITHDKSDYSNEYYRTAMGKISQFCLVHEMNHQHFKETSENFISKIYPELRVYHNNRSDIVSEFSFVFLDGDHALETIYSEFMFFYPKIVLGGGMVIDDTGRHLDALREEFSDIKFEKMQGNRVVIRK